MYLFSYLFFYLFLVKSLLLAEFIKCVFLLIYSIIFKGWLESFIKKILSLIPEPKWKVLCIVTHSAREAESEVFLSQWDIQSQRNQSIFWGLHLGYLLASIPHACTPMPTTRTIFTVYVSGLKHQLSVEFIWRFHHYHKRSLKLLLYIFSNCHTVQCNGQLVFHLFLNMPVIFDTLFKIFDFFI